jgi:hypothetical protein
MDVHLQADVYGIQTHHKVSSLRLKVLTSQTDAYSLDQAIMLNNKSNLRSSVILMSVMSVTYHRHEFAIAKRPVNTRYDLPSLSDNACENERVQSSTWSHSGKRSYQMRESRRYEELQ